MKLKLAIAAGDLAQRQSKSKKSGEAATTLLDACLSKRTPCQKRACVLLWERQKYRNLIAWRTFYVLCALEPAKR
ncbi:MAG: hypothetical protein LBU32_32390 [Clostridiales bacterium]|nr:hypothetical protein [Clostridiales bacterium]